MTRAKRLSALAVTGVMLLAGASAPASHADDPSIPSPVVTVESEAAGNAAATETTRTTEAITPNPTAEEAPSENLDPSGIPSEEFVVASLDSTETPSENPILKEAPYSGMMSVTTIPITTNPGQTDLGYQLGQLAPTEAAYRFSVLSFAWETASGTPATFAYRTQSDGYWGDWQILIATEELSFTDQVIVSASSALEVIVFGETDSSVTGLKAVLTAFPEGEAPTAQPTTTMFRTFSAAPALYSSGETQQQFIDRIAPLAQEDEKKWKVPASVSMAQAILESGWGKSTLTTQYHNYFGIKCWAGQTSTYPTGCVDMATGEYYGGAYVTITAGFRVYANAQDSFMDHGQFLNVNSRYAPAFSTTSSDAFARAIHAAGYATSPTYSDSLINLMKIYNLYQYDGKTGSSSSDGGSSAEGPFTVDGWIGALYNSNTGLSRELGKPTSGEIRPKDRSDVVYQTFENGRIYALNALKGAVSTHGWIGKEYATLGYHASEIGYPTSGEIRPKDRSDVVYQTFDEGRIYSLNSLGKAVSTHGWIGDEYASLGYQDSALGYPTSAEKRPSNRNDVVYQAFEGGGIYVLRSTLSVVSGKIGQTYLSLGGPDSSLGAPTGSAIKINSTNSYQQFEGGRIYLTSTGTAYSVLGWIGNKYAASSYENGALGYPTSGEIRPTNRADVVYQEFQNGRIYVVGSATVTVSGKAHQHYLSQTTKASSLGFPLEDLVKINSTNSYQQFEGGRIYLTSTGTAYSVLGWIGNKYASLGNEKSKLGYPISEEIRVSAFYVYQDYQGGRIMVTTADGIVVTYK